MNDIILIEKHFLEHETVLKSINKYTKKKISKAAEIISKSLKNKGTIYWCGNGGSASDSLHLSTELIGKFNKNRKPLKSVSLASNSTTLTCIANDFGYDKIFSRQLEALGKKGDVVILLSTSGDSKNILQTLNQAKKNRVYSISFLGKKGGKCKNKADLEIIINSKSTARIQEMHITIGQIICDLIEKKLKL